MDSHDHRVPAIDPSATLSRLPTDRAWPTEPVTVSLSVKPLSDAAGIKSAGCTPSHACFPVDQDFVLRLYELQALCCALGLEEVHTTHYPIWTDAVSASSIRMDEERLSVTRSAFQLSALSRATNQRFTSDRHEIGQFLEDLLPTSQSTGSKFTSAPHSDRPWQ